MSKVGKESDHEVVNGLDVTALKQVINDVAEDSSKGMVEFRVKTEWKGQTSSETSVDSYTIGGTEIPRSFKIQVDEPCELLGTNTAPNPQEMLMTALNTCIMVGYTAGAAVKGIKLEKLEIATKGELDLRGFLGIDPDIRPGYESIAYTVTMKGNGTPEQFQEIHENVIKTSPNYFNVSQPIRIDAKLVVEK